MLTTVNEVKVSIGINKTQESAYPSFLNFILKLRISVTQKFKKHVNTCESDQMHSHFAKNISSIHNSNTAELVSDGGVLGRWLNDLFCYSSPTVLLFNNTIFQISSLLLLLVA